ncbi:hypothetical protein D3M59_08525 [Sphingomonas edaphi]|uniref:Uncharacterized protein n=1 Tax=Sphingomonas edaphi TaxID=2315689 RepID=A0A418PZR7_9SPHN|nr:hypothetical protein D3M59_08525 [Sphingomonas edaphi]
MSFRGANGLLRTTAILIEVAAIGLGRSSDAADKKEKPEESPQPSEEAAAIVNAIINQPAAPQ